MSKNLLKSLALLIPIMLLLSTFASVNAVNIANHDAQPQFDEAFMKVISNPDAAVSAFQACEVEFLPDMIRWANINKLLSEGQTILASPGYHYCYIAMNCRNYVPDDAEQPDAGRPLAPLNWTDFRQALLWAGLSHAEKEAAILQIYGGPIVSAVDSPVPPSLGIWHWEPSYYPGCNYTKAEEYLVASGFTIVAGKLIQPNGVEVRDQIEVLSPSSAPTSVAFAQKFVNKWNDFMDNFLGVTNCNFFNNPVDFGTVLVPRAFTYRNFDMYMMCWGLGRFADYLYDFFHSSQDYPDSNNAPGVKDPALDHDLERLKWGTVFEDKLAHCYDAQRLLIFEDCPTIELYSRTYFTAFKNYTAYNPTHEPKWLDGMFNEKGQGADNGYTWGLMDWEYTADLEGGVIKYVLGNALVHLHPGWASSAYEWDCLNRIFDGLMGVDLNMGDMPSIACEWSTEPFTWLPLNIVEGTKVRFQIRSDVTWQDGFPVTIQDVKFAFDFLRNFPRYGPITQYLMWTQVVDDCHIDVYLNTTSQYIVYDLAGVALLFPLHMYGCTFTYDDFPPGESTTYVYPDGWLETHGYDPINAAVDQILYGVGGCPKALIGCGPYIFDYWNPQTNIAHLIKNENYWFDGPIKANIIQPQKWDPCNPFTFYIEVVNGGTEYNSEVIPDPGEPDSEFGPFIIDYIDVTADGEVIFTIPGPIVVPGIEEHPYVILGPYEWHFDKCIHYLDVHIYGYTAWWTDPAMTLYDSYVCPMVVSIVEDVTDDCYVGIDDIFAAASAFGSQPPPFAGYERWNAKADMNGDYYIGIDDIFDIAVHFGWDA